MTAAWVTFVGIGEDGLAGLPAVARTALDAAQVVFGGPRHLALAGVAGARGRTWPVPFDIAPVLACRGQAVVVLASGDPFWHGAGSSVAAHLGRGEWISHPAPSTFQHMANRLGWRLEEAVCLGLHAAPFARLLPHLHPGARLLCTLRDGAAAGDVAAWLAAQRFGASTLTVMEHLGGPAERLRETKAAPFTLDGIGAPVAMAIMPDGAPGLPRSAGLPEVAFAHDGQITKSPVRALTLAALAPRPGQHLWDLGAGSGSVSVEYCLAGGRATAVEARGDRAANIRANAETFGLTHRLAVIEGRAPEAVSGLATPDAVFIGGGCDAALIAAVWDALPPSARLVVNGVTLETEALLATAHAEKGGILWRFEIASAGPLGRSRGWQPARPVVQWSVTR